MNDPGIHLFESERYCYSLFHCIDERHGTERDSPCQVHSTSYVLMYHLGVGIDVREHFSTQMFQLPSVITNTIAATRIYRSLAEYSFDSPNMYYCILRSLTSPALIIVGGFFLQLTRRWRLKKRHQRLEDEVGQTSADLTSPDRSRGGYRLRAVSNTTRDDHA